MPGAAAIRVWPIALERLAEPRVSGCGGGRRTSPYARSALDLTFRAAGQSVEILEVCRCWRGAHGEIAEGPLARAMYVEQTELWRLYRMRADLKWHVYASYATSEASRHAWR